MKRSFTTSSLAGLADPNSAPGQQGRMRLGDSSSSVACSPWRRKCAVLPRRAFSCERLHYHAGYAISPSSASAMEPATDPGLPLYVVDDTLCQDLPRKALRIEGVPGLEEIPEQEVATLQMPVRALPGSSPLHPLSAAASPTPRSHSCRTVGTSTSLSNRVEDQGPLLAQLLRLKIQSESKSSVAAGSSGGHVAQGTSVIRDVCSGDMRGGFWLSGEECVLVPALSLR